MPKPRTRAPTHAGSWYPDDPVALRASVQAWLAAAAPPPGAAPYVRAVIAPHAGHRYCGAVMAAAYARLARAPPRVTRVFLLGPSHHFFSRRCHLSPHAAYGCPLGDVPLDAAACAALAATGAFEPLAPAADEAEHSLELHLPFLAAAFAGRPLTLVPIVVGALGADAEAEYGALLAPHLADPANAFVVSSDFCHWGRRFSYTPFLPSSPRGGGGKVPVGDAVEALDREGMALIEAGDPAAFRAHLAATGNTVCGRHPILVFMHAARALERRREGAGGGLATRFLAYDQSVRLPAAPAPGDSSVSYAAAVCVLRGGGGGEGEGEGEEERVEAAGEAAADGAV